MTATPRTSMSSDMEVASGRLADVIANAITDINGQVDPTSAVSLAELLTGRIVAAVRASRRVDSVEKLFSLPIGSTVRSERSGTISIRLDEGYGGAVGQQWPYPWQNVALPATVLSRPDDHEVRPVSDA